MKRYLLPLLALAGLGLLAGIVAHRRASQPLNYQGKPLNAWSMQSYYSPDPKLRDEATAAIQAMGVRAVPGLIQLLQAKDAFVNERAWSLASTLPRRWRRLVQRAFKPPEAAAIRAAAARSLGLVGPEAQTAIPLLAASLRDSQGTVVWDAATALARIGSNSVPFLSEALQNTNAIVRRAAAGALAQIGPAAKTSIPSLLRCLNEENELVRAAAVSALSSIGMPALPALIDAVEHQRGRARQAAATALMRVYPIARVVEAPLLEMASDENPASRKQAIDLLVSIHDTHATVITAFSNALRDPVLEVRLAGASALGQAGIYATTAVTELTGRLKDPSPSLRAACAQALGQIGPRAKPAVSELNRLADDPEEVVRAAAAEALAKIGTSPAAEPGK